MSETSKSVEFLKMIRLVINCCYHSDLKKKKFLAKFTGIVLIFCFKTYVYGESEEKRTMKLGIKELITLKKKDICI